MHVEDIRLNYNVRGSRRVTDIVYLNASYIFWESNKFVFVLPYLLKNQKYDLILKQLNLLSLSANTIK